MKGVDFMLTYGDHPTIRALYPTTPPRLFRVTPIVKAEVETMKKKKTDISCSEILIRPST
jgi:hypothetical protein